MHIGTHVRVKATASSFYNGRKGIVVEFDPNLKWSMSPRAQLCPDQCICVHFFPKTGLERRRGSPLAMMFEHELAVLPDSSFPKDAEGTKR